MPNDSVPATITVDSSSNHRITVPTVSVRDKSQPCDIVFTLNAPDGWKFPTATPFGFDIASDQTGEFTYARDSDTQVTVTDKNNDAVNPTNHNFNVTLVDPDGNSVTPDDPLIINR